MEMSFADIIKESVLKGFTGGNLTTIPILVTLGIAVAMGLYIFLIYRLAGKGGFYNRSFNKSLAVLPVITAGIMLAMQSNLVISLGMVGALSIVRFRNAVKDAADLTFLFWSISMGIITGAGLYELALLLSLCATALVFLLDLIPTFRAPFLLIVSGTSQEQEQALFAAVQEYSPRFRVRSRNMTVRGVEWIVELRTKQPEQLLARVGAIEGLDSINLLSHDGEVRF